jgi:hypothetical protein
MSLSLVNKVMEQFTAKAGKSPAEISALTQTGQDVNILYYQRKERKSNVSFCGQRGLLTG